MSNQLTNSNVTFDDLLTPDVYRVALSHAEKYARRMGPEIDAADLVHDAFALIMATYKDKPNEVGDLGALLTNGIEWLYIDWTIDEETAAEWDVKQGAYRRRYYRMTRGITDYLDPVDENGQPCEMTMPVPSQLQTPPGTDHMILRHDVETAIQKLDPMGQRVIRAYMTSEGYHHDDTPYQEIGRKVGVSRWVAMRLLPKALAQLQVLLADYAPHTERTSHEKSA